VWEWLSKTIIVMNPLIVLDNITTRVRDRFILKETSWKILEGQSWAVIGPNGSGKTSLTRVVAGRLPVIFGKKVCGKDLVLKRDVAIVSFEFQRELLEREAVKEASRFFSGKIFEITTPRMVIQDDGEKRPVSWTFLRSVGLAGIEALPDRNLFRLSTGEVRKILIARALLKRPKILILDEPFEGLDSLSRQQIEKSINLLIRHGVMVIMVTHRLDAVPSEITHVICLKDNRVVAKGPKTRILTPELVADLYGPLRGWKGPESLAVVNGERAPAELIRMKNVTVKFNGQSIFHGLDWCVRRGENWMISGPNGAGKTTLLSLISGDNPQAYSNEIYLFGTRRGTGESIWDIKRRIGLVSMEFQMAYRHELSVEEVILSGFFDSIGLYRRPSALQKETAQEWTRRLGIAALRGEVFTRLSFGEQKMVLMARAMVKAPLLLILDEPCQGLDPVNRRLVLDVIDRIGIARQTSILYVTHRPEEEPACIDRVLNVGCFNQNRKKRRVE
jgi:molybdate transport system ATP-binding protein